MDVAATLSLVGAGIDTAGKAFGLLKVFRDKGAKPEEIAAAENQILEMKSALQSAKKTMIAQTDEIADLVQQIKDLKIRLAQREEYVLEKIGARAFVFINKDMHNANKDGPWFCQPCFEKSARCQ